MTGMIKLTYVILIILVLLPCIPGTTRTNVIALSERWPDWFAWGIGLGLTAGFLLLNMTKNRGFILNFLMIAIGVYSTLLAVNTMEISEIKNTDSRTIDDYKLKRLYKQADDLNEQYKLCLETQKDIEKINLEHTSEKWSRGSEGARKRAEQLERERTDLLNRINITMLAINNRSAELEDKGSYLKESSSKLFFLSFVSADKIIGFMNTGLSLLNDLLIYIAFRMLHKVFPSAFTNLARKKDKLTLMDFLTIKYKNRDNGRHNGDGKLTGVPNECQDGYKEISSRVKKRAVKKMKNAFPWMTDKELSIAIAKDMGIDIPRTTVNYHKKKLERKMIIPPTQKWHLWI